MRFLTWLRGTGVKPGVITLKQLEPCHQQHEITFDHLKKDGQNIRRDRIKPGDINALVFQGGGAKGIAYCGAIKQLAEKGVLQNATRFGGASAGAICAAFLALGCTPDEMGELLKHDFDHMLRGDKWYDYVLYYIPVQKRLRQFLSAVQKYGVYSTKSFHGWMGKEFKKQVTKKEQANTNVKRIKDKQNITFREVYDVFGTELCVIVSNLSTQTEEYYHPKTTPDFPVRKAVRMSMSIPVLFRPITIPFYKEMEYYVDGGFICNYPVHCFDGWWLSMDPEDAFTKKLEGSFQNICRTLRTRRFESTNREPKTLGFRVVTEVETKTDQREKENVTLWDTELARKYSEKINAMNKGRDTVHQVDDLLNVLRNGNNQPDCTVVSRTEILDCLSNAPELKKKLKKEQREGDIRFTFRDLQSAIYEITKRSLAEWMTDNPRGKISDMTDFMYYLYNLINVTSKADNVYGDYQEHNEWRTITIETKYIGTTDFKMVDWDKQFLIKQGEEATKAYFEHNQLQDTKE